MRFSEDDLKKMLQNPALKISDSKKKEQVTKNKSIITEMKDDVEDKNNKRKGVDVSKSISTISSSLIQVHSSNIKGEESFAVWYPGVRILSLNEIFAILERRKYEAFRYKKAWQEAIQKAVMLTPISKRPYFDGPTRITLYRRGARLIDLDSFQTMFKYPIDALRYSGILAEDNPNIIVETKSVQEKGEKAVALKLERLYDWQDIEKEDIHLKWFGKSEK